MTQEFEAFWKDKRRAEAAQLVADGELTDEQIAERLGKSRSWLARLKRQGTFMARVLLIVDKQRRDVEAEGIVLRQNRVNALNDRWRKMQVIVQERAADPKFQDVPGYKTGLMMHTVKSLGHGVIVDLYALDGGLLGELRAHEEQAAKELGQWTEKFEHGGDDAFTAALGRVANAVEAARRAERTESST